MTEGTQGKDQSLQPFQPQQKELLKQEGNPLRQTLELMQRNGTDRDTIKAYVACAYATELMLGEVGSDNRLSYPGVGEIPLNPDAYLWIKGMGRIRFMKGGPQDVTSGVTIELSQYAGPDKPHYSWEDYYPSWKEYVKDDPYYHESRKENGALNSCRNIIIYPGTEDKPGNMYSIFFRTENELIVEKFEKIDFILPPILKKRVIDAWGTLVEFFRRVPLIERDKGSGESKYVKAFFDGWTGLNRGADRTLKLRGNKIGRLLGAIRLGIAKPRTKGLEGLAFEIRKRVEEEADFWGSVTEGFLNEIKHWKYRHPRRPS